MLRSRKTARLVSGAIVILAIALTYVLRESQEPHTISTSGGVILVAGSTHEGMDAAFESHLAFTAEGCLGLAGPDETVADVVAVFPAGTKVVEESPLTIRVNGHDVELGQVFRGGGGEVEQPTNGDVLPTGPARCLTRAVWLLSPE